MRQSNYTVTVLEPSEGHVLTQVREMDKTERVFSRKIYLASNDSPDNWTEITTEEAARIETSNSME